MAIDRSAARNVHIYDANDSTNVLGGLILNDGVTNENFYQMIDILFIFESQYFLQNEGGVRIQKNHHLLVSGKYYLVSTGQSYLFILFYRNQTTTDP